MYVYLIEVKVHNLLSKCKLAWFIIQLDLYLIMYLMHCP